MKVTSTGIENGFWADRFGKFGTQKNSHGKATRSVPFSVSDAPEGTKSFAVIMDDIDAIPVCGFNWIHWVLCDLTGTEVAEDASAGSPDFVQGCTSFHGGLGDESIEEASCYGGMAPPDKEHDYTLTVYALDCKLGLKQGFYLNELKKAMRGHVLSHCSVTAAYRA